MAKQKTIEEILAEEMALNGEKRQQEFLKAVGEPITANTEVVAHD